MTLDLEALAETPQRSDPFDWGYAPQAIPRRSAATLLATFPDSGFWKLESGGGEKFFRYSARPLVLLGQDHAVDPGSLHPAWRTLADELRSPAYRGALERACGRSLDGALMEAAVWRWGKDAELGPHLDMESKILTQVFYFNVGWDAGWGGALRILRSRNEEDVFAELPPRLGSSSLLVRSERSWHCVTPVQSRAPTERLSLIVTWLHAGSESPGWQILDDGEFIARAGGTREDETDV